MDGDGVETIAFADSQTFFDLDGDGLAQKTGWVSRDDALLVFDREASGGVEDISAVFGSETNDGFSELAREDHNGHGVIDANGDSFAELRLWQGQNSDAIAREEELASLEEAEITSIDLNAIAGNFDVAAGNVNHGSTVTRADDIVLDREQIATGSFMFGTVGFDRLNIDNTAEFANAPGQLTVVINAGDDILDGFGAHIRALNGLGDGFDTRSGASVREFTDVNSDGIRLMRTVDALTNVELL